MLKSRLCLNRLLRLVHGKNTSSSAVSLLLCLSWSEDACGSLLAVSGMLPGIIEVAKSSDDGPFFRNGIRLLNRISLISRLSIENLRKFTECGVIDCLRANVESLGPSWNQSQQAIDRITDASRSQKRRGITSTKLNT